ncbi:hypothetical protein GGR54DRAFT_615700 [Hypoxylon sp. NC1633]|nr:hypothetical protein GGR54DRAFT_615700 [Hypoxylon sp. NC1633]
MPASADIQAATLDRFLAGWKEFTPESWTATWSEDFQQQLLPFTLGVPAQTRDQAKSRLSKLMGLLTNYEVEFYEVVHDAVKGKAFIYARSTADTAFEDFKWTNDYAVIITFTEDGKQVRRFEEMVDTAFFQKFFPRFQQYLSEQGATK